MQAQIMVVILTDSKSIWKVSSFLFIIGNAIAMPLCSYLWFGSITGIFDYLHSEFGAVSSEMRMHGLRFVIPIGLGVYLLCVLFNFLKLKFSNLKWHR